VQHGSLAQLYSSKTDDELLALAANRDSLAQEALATLADELRRRKLPLQSEPLRDEFHPEAISHLSASGAVYPARAKWVGLWVLNTLIGTLGVAITVGFFTYSSQAFVSRATRIHFVLTPYYLFPILIGLAAGYLSYLRFRGSYRYWVWILPAAYVLYSLLGWKASNQGTWSDALTHYFGSVPYPQNRDQLETSMWLYVAMAYSLGALTQRFVQKMLSCAVAKHQSHARQ
jgi:hypothetical protein